MDTAPDNNISVHAGRKINHISLPADAHRPGDLGYGGLALRTGYLRQDTRPVPFVSVKLRRYVRLEASRLSLAKTQGADLFWSFDIAGATVDAYENDRRISIWLTDSMRRRRRVIVLCAADHNDFLLWAYWLKRASEAVLERHYEMSSYLNKGSFARVVLGRDLHNGRAVAIKLIEKSNATPSEQRYMQRERDIIRSIHHSNIVTCLDIFDSTLRTRIVMEHMAGGMLSDVIKERAGIPLPEHEAREILRGVLAGLNYLHSQSIVHRDIKPDNILVSSNKYPYGPVKLSDFGLSNYTGRAVCATEDDKERILSSAVGSPAFVAPELFDANYGPPVDLWSVGVVLYLMLTGGTLPFSGNTSTDIMLAVKRGLIDMKAIRRGSISENARNLLLALLNTNAAKRLTATQALRHPWIQHRPLSGGGLPPLPPSAPCKVRSRRSGSQLLMPPPSSGQHCCPGPVSDIADKLNCEPCNSLDWNMQNEVKSQSVSENAEPRHARTDYEIGEYDSGATTNSSTDDMFADCQGEPSEADNICDGIDSAYADLPQVANSNFPKSRGLLSAQDSPSLVQNDSNEAITVGRSVDMNRKKPSRVVAKRNRKRQRARQARRHSPNVGFADHGLA